MHNTEYLRLKTNTYTQYFWRYPNPIFLEKHKPNIFGNTQTQYFWNHTNPILLEMHKPNTSRNTPTQYFWKYTNPIFLEIHKSNIFGNTQIQYFWKYTNPIFLEIHKPNPEYSSHNVTCQPQRSRFQQQRAFGKSSFVILATMRFKNVSYLS